MLTLQHSEMRMVRWMCGVKLQDRVPSKGLTERLGLDDIISVLQQNRLQWYGHVLQKFVCTDSTVKGKQLESMVSPQRALPEIKSSEDKVTGLSSTNCV